MSILLSSQVDAPPTLPRPRGPVSAALLAHLAGRPREIGPLPVPADDPLYGDDTALGLHVCYELHYRGWSGVDNEWEWEPSLLRERRRLEKALEQRLSEEVGPVPDLARDAVAPALVALATDQSGPSLSRYMAETGTLEEMREFAVHRSIYQRKEADPHTWAIPRLTGEAKAALVDIQFGEYGEGDATRMHAALFANTMRCLDLDDRYGYYLDDVPGTTLATCNLVSLFGLHRRWRAALVGHLALFEMCSVGPMGRYRDALLRLGVDAAATRFYDDHVVADERHQVVALESMASGLARSEPEASGAIVFGARALAAIEARFAGELLSAWADGRTSLRRALPCGRGLR